MISDWNLFLQVEFLPRGPHQDPPKFGCTETSKRGHQEAVLRGFRVQVEMSRILVLVQADYGVMEQLCKNRTVHGHRGVHQDRWVCRS